MLERLREPWSDQRAERTRGALASLVLLVIVLMIVFVAARAWPSFAHNGLSWFGASGNVDQQLGEIFNSPAKPAEYVYGLHAWPLVYGTVLTAVVSVLAGVTIATLAAIFIVEFAPAGLRRLLEPVVRLLAAVFLVEFAPGPVRLVLRPVVRLLAAVPSVIYGLIGVLVLVPFVGNHLISQGRKESVIYVVQLSGNSLLVACAILTLMITPIMVAIIVDALRSVPRGWTEGSAALGVNRWRTIWTISVRASRPAIIAAAVLATARALGEAIMLSMVSGSVGFSPNPLDGITFFFEPVRPLAATIVDNAEGLSVKPFGQTIYAFAALLLLSSFVLSVGGWLAKQPLKRYGVRI
jgi:ABC-type phosphate transport system permease subunit